MKKLSQEELQKLVNEAEKGLTRSGTLKTAVEGMVAKANAQGYELCPKEAKKLLVKKCAEEVARYCESMNQSMRG